jgi:excisionase family DNA binding protein
MNENNELEVLITAEELGERIGVNTETVRRWAVMGRIPAYRVGNRVVRFNYEEVKQVMRNDFIE